MVILAILLASYKSDQINIVPWARLLNQQMVHIPQNFRAPKELPKQPHSFLIHRQQLLPLEPNIAELIDE